MDWSDLVDFKTKGVIFQIKNDPITMKLWVIERDEYTRIQNKSKSFESRMYIFVMETTTLEIKLNNTVKLHVLVTSSKLSWITFLTMVIKYKRELFFIC